MSKLAGSQNAFLRGEKGEQQVTQESSVLKLPTDYPSHTSESIRAVYEFEWSNEIRKKLQAFCLQESSTLFTTLLAGFSLLIHRYTDQSDLNIACAEQVGTNFAGFLMHLDVGGAQTASELVALVENATDQSRTIQDQQAIQSQIAFAFGDGTLEVDIFGDPRLHLMMGTLSDGLQGTLVYDASLWKPETIERMVQHLQKLLIGMVEHPQGRPQEVNYLTEEELAQLLVEWNKTDIEFPATLCLHQLFEAQVQRTPDLIAAVIGEQELTYKDLHERANQLAHHLQQLGVGPDVPVGVCIERSLDLVVGVLAVLKAGGAYVPFDPEAPADRIRTVMIEAQMPVCLAQAHLKGGLPLDATLYVFVDEEREQIAKYPVTNPSSSVQPEHLVSIYYTSGSTGKPKGVMNVHRGWVNRMCWMQRYHQLQPGETVLQKTTLTFDAAGIELFWPLMAGGRIALLEPGLHRDPRAILDATIRYQVAALQFVPSVLNLVLDEITAADQEKLGFLRTVTSAGEALRPETVRLFQAKVGAHCNLHNTWGATEVSIDSTIHTCTVEDGEETDIITIGKPFDNNQVYLLDGHLQPVPIGVAGDLYLAGVGLARGYLNNPEKTAEAFLANPFVPGEMLYKTGDRGLYQTDGSLRFLGREDNQVKIRGVRVELGEVENVLSLHEAVKDAVVLAHEHKPGDKRLVGYVVLFEEQESTTRELRAYLKSKLPDYMVPTTLLVLETLPLNANGKVDRKQLPVPDLTKLVLDEHEMAPRNPVEEIVERIFGQVLGVERVGVERDFFDLGGHSLLATQVISRIRRTFGIAMPMSDLFDAPTIAGLAVRVQAALQANKNVQDTAILPIPREGDLPLSFAQQRLWFLDQLEGGSSTYNEPMAYRLQGCLDVSALERSLQELVRRHEILRTTFVARDGVGVQVIAPDLVFTLPRVDLTQVSEAERELQLMQVQKEETGRIFDLSAGPLFVAKLVQVQREEYLLFLNMHHIITDGWSIDVLLQELSVLYQAFVEGNPLPLPELPIQYGDFSAWQREWLQGEELEQQLGYWKQKLGGELPVLQLPIDRPRPKKQTYKGAMYSFALPKPLHVAVQQLSKTEATTMYMTLLAAFKTMLYRYTGQEDLLVGSPIANRNRSEIEGLIGFFVNTMVLRSHVAGNLTFRELLHQVRETALGAYAHQDLPFEKLVEELQPERLNHSPLFQVMFALQNMPSGVRELQGVTLQTYELEHEIAKFDLTLFLYEDEEKGIVGEFEYNTDLFDASTIERMSAHFGALLASIVDQPDQLIAKFPLLTEQEQQQLLVDWNQTRTDYPQLSLQELFELQVAHTPEATAVVFGTQTLTYAELNQQANRVAQTLKQVGVGPAVPVGICVERSLELIIGLLAIVKAGGAYVPLDANYPQDRLRFMFEDAQVQVLLTKHTVQEIIVKPDIKVIFLDDVLADGVTDHIENVPCTASIDDLAYIIYTSGSTGTPKGVCVPQRGVVRLVKETDYVDFTADEVFLQFAPVSFDAATFEIWGALLNGARLVICPPEQMSLEALAQMIREHQITTLFLTTALFHQMAEFHWQELGQVRQLLAGGEQMSLAQVRNLFEKLPNWHFHHVYGPTESTTFAVSKRIEHSDTFGATVPIGRPIANTTMYVLDKQMQPVPVGVPGELYIGGDGLAHGYLNRQDITTERFVQHPFGETGERLYKTGDLVRYLADGNLEFIGRIDNQVKIRGFRIELGEIESLLTQHEAVQEAIVTVHESEANDKRLIGYVVLKQGTLVSTEEVRAVLKNKLPDYMIPAVLVQLEALPLGPTGKADRKALPIPDLMEGEPGHENVSPRNPVEEIVERIFGQVLGVERVGVDRDFFDLGGHSLLATQVISRIRLAFGLALPLSDLFDAPTIAGLAVRVQAALQANKVQDTPILPVPREGDLPLSFSQQRLWFLDQLEEGSSAYNVPIAYRLQGCLDVSALERSLQELVRRHEILRTTFVERDGEGVQVIAPDLAFALQQVDLTQMSETEREMQLLQVQKEENGRIFDLTAGPLFVAKLVQVQREEYLLFLNMHHIITDGWSIEVLLQELSVMYQAFVEGNPMPLPELAIQYGDFSAWQREWLQGEVLEQQLGYWKQKLGGELPVLQLPTDRPRPKQQTYKGTLFSFALPKSLHVAVQQLSQTEATTMYMTLLAAFKTMLYGYTGQEDILVGTPIANRNRSEIEGLVGFFVNTLVLRSHVAGNLTFRDLLHQVRETALGAYTHQDLPFEKLVEELQPERLNHSPLFQVMFVLQNMPSGVRELQGVTLQPYELEYEVSKFDLTLYLSEDEEKGLVGGFEYNTDLFDVSTIERMSAHFVELLASIVEQPDQLIANLPLIGGVQPAQRKPIGAEHEFLIPADLTTQIRSFSEQQDVTLFMTLLTGFNLLLMRHSGKTDVWVGAPSANRNRSEREDRIGFSMKTQMIRTDFSGNPTYLESLQRVKQETLEVLAQQDVPYDKHVEERQEDGESVLFQVMFQLSPDSAVEFNGMQIETENIHTGTANDHLSFQVVEVGSDLHGSMEYNCDLYEAPFIERLAKQFIHVLRECMKAPDLRINSIKLTEESHGYDEDELDGLFE